uniref:NADH-ubiquinone oxidoreductase chain 6 n=1 Tax=Aspidoscelis exsanguis TaxID=2202118 RepID=A0A977TML9_9SAUR|nr:NADH dehydrogenase subunit 6 [Aspidoscelis exsanguis]UXX18061.1 NADH dehydrogenase subunit 6 [Aspidoscelis exsanguis]UXX18269.1 NADH dehydrogenase subunit 6 [Aspidoscelis exsanguis]UXX18347.1 NADH dehydrogenase subunit 6 [Aspidoscelis exsanguis]UXX18919.1 NADH dehydrogenase subunit 6 [Aspidoscelis exsanguis]
MYVFFVLIFCILFGTVGVACHPSPFFGAVSLLFCVLGGCLYLLSLGVSFVGVVLLLVYLGGVLVVYAYSIALACDGYSETWGSRPVLGYVLSYSLFVLFMFCLVGDFYNIGVWFGVVEDVVGVSLLYSYGGGVLLLCGVGLLLCLFSALELVRGRVRGGLRMV